MVRSPKMLPQLVFGVLVASFPRAAIGFSSAINCYPGPCPWELPGWRPRPELGTKVYSTRWSYTETPHFGHWNATNNQCMCDPGFTAQFANEVFEISSSANPFDEPTGRRLAFNLGVGDAAVARAYAEEPVLTDDTWVALPRLWEVVSEISAYETSNFTCVLPAPEWVGTPCGELCPGCAAAGRHADGTFVNVGCDPNVAVPSRWCSCSEKLLCAATDLRGATQQCEALQEWITTTSTPHDAPRCIMAASACGASTAPPVHVVTSEDFIEAYHEVFG